MAQTFGEKADSDSVTVLLDRTISLTDGHTLSYYTVDNVAPDMLIQLIEQLHENPETRVIEQVGTRSRVEVVTAGETLASTLATYGGRLVEPIVQDGEFTAVVQIPQRTDIRRFSEAITTAYPDMEFVSKKELARENRTPEDSFATLTEQLTDRQRTALEVGLLCRLFQLAT